MSPENFNPILKKLRRVNEQHKPTGKADAFFGQNQKAKIIDITNTSIQYIDETETLNTIALSDCIYCSELEKDYVGKRGLLSSPPWIEFFDKQHTRFEFESKKDATSLVLEALTKMNLKTIDMD